MRKTALAIPMGIAMIYGNKTAINTTQTTHNNMNRKVSISAKI